MIGRLLGCNLRAMALLLAHLAFNPVRPDNRADWMFVYPMEQGS